LNRWLRENAVSTSSFLAGRFDAVGLTGSSLFEAKTAILNLDGDYLLAKSELSAQGGAIARIRTELFQAISIGRKPQNR